MEIKVIKDLKSNDWDNFVNSSNNGTIFHQLKFLQYHPKSKYNFLNLAFYEKDKLITVLPGILENNVFKSPGGASYGSFITENLPFRKYEEVIDSFFVYAKKNKFKEIYLTSAPIIYMKNQNEIEKFLLEYKGFKKKYSLISNAVNLETFKDEKDILNKITSMHRRAIKKSFNSNLIIEFNSDFESFYSILLDNKKKFNTKPTHTLEEILKIKKLYPNHIKLLMAYDKNKNPLAGILLIVCNSNVVLTFYISHYYQFQNLRAVNRLFYESLIWSKNEGYKWLDLGVSMDTSSDNPMEPSRNLIFFKEGINTRGFLRTTYYYKFK